MKVSLIPPTLREVLGDLSVQVFETFISNSHPLVGDRYVHWDKIRHRQPPTGLTPEQWWVAIKLARNSH